MDVEYLKDIVTVEQGIPGKCKGCDCFLNTYCARIKKITDSLCMSGNSGNNTIIFKLKDKKRFDMLYKVWFGYTNTTI